MDDFWNESDEKLPYHGNKLLAQENFGTDRSMYPWSRDTGSKCLLFDLKNEFTDYSLEKLDFTSNSTLNDLFDTITIINAY